MVSAHSLEGCATGEDAKSDAEFDALDAFDFFFSRGALPNRFLPCADAAVARADAYCMGGRAARHDRLLRARLFGECNMPQNAKNVAFCCILLHRVAWRPNGRDLRWITEFATLDAVIDVRKA